MEQRSELEEYSYSEYTYAESIKFARDVLKNINLSGKQVIFDEDKWSLYLVLQKRYTHFYFDKIAKDIVNSKLNILEYSDVIVRIKCWAASLLAIYEPSRVRQYLLTLQLFFDLNRDISKISFENFYPKYIKLKKSHKTIIHLVLLNLIDYDESFFGENVEEIVFIAQNLASKIKKDYKVKSIPSTLDYLILDYVVFDYFNRDLSYEEYIYWTSIELWWKLTTIIPMRISEYCLIEKKNVYPKNNHFYIDIVRVKGHYSEKEKMATKVSIPEEYYLKIEKYIEELEKVDSNTNTIFSRQVIRDLMYSKKVKIRFSDFNALFFRTLLKEFYEKIVVQEYGYLDYQNTSLQVSPNDTRHLAFINLKMQGFHPVVVMNLGGHKHLKTQEHYFHHINNMMDLEALALFSCFKFSQVDNINKDFVLKHVLKGECESLDQKKKLKLGYCVSEKLNCRVRKCMDCNFWRIDIEELNAKREILKKNMEENKHNIYTVYEKMNKIYVDISKDVALKTDIYSEIGIGPEKAKLENLSIEFKNLLNHYLNLNVLYSEVNNTGK